MKGANYFAAVFLIAISFSSGAFAQSFLFGPKGEFKTSFIGRSLEYDPSRSCSKPSRPYSDDGFAWNRYRNDALRYVDCLKANTETDLEYAQGVVQEGYKKATEEFLREIRRQY